MQRAKSIRDYLTLLESSSDQQFEQYCYNGLTQDQQQLYPKENFYSGKVREMIKSNDFYYMHHTDRLSAFDKFIALAPLKGILLNTISSYWMGYVQDKVDNHLIEVIDERTLKVRSLEPFKIEVVVRGYMAGSLQKKYDSGIHHICGQDLPKNLEANAKFAQPIITPTTKAAAYEHDEEISPEQIIQQKLCTSEEWQQISALALQLFKLGERRYSEIGWTLVDTKYEFGKDSSGKIYLIDELHTPDSSRLWLKDVVQDSYLSDSKLKKTPEMFDKQIIRKFLTEKGFDGNCVVPKVPKEIILRMLIRYNEIAEKLTGSPVETTGIYQGLPKKHAKI